MRCPPGRLRRRPGELDEVGVDEVGLGKGDDAVLYAEEVDDGEVFASLGHDAFVGGDHEKGEVDAANAGEHVLDEALMAGDVDDADLLAAGESKPGKAEVDGEAAVLLLLQTVRVDAGERLDKGGLAVVDVSGGTDYVHGYPAPPRPAGAGTVEQWNKVSARLLFC